MFNGPSGVCMPAVTVGINDRVFISLGMRAPSLVGTRQEMQAFAEKILEACGKPERFIDGDVQQLNDDIHPRAVAQ